MDIPSAANPWLDFFVKVGAALVAAATLLRSWRGRRARLQQESEDRIKDAIMRATRPIQPDANGGKSLADLHEKIDKVMDRQTLIQQNLLDHLQHHDNVDDQG